MTATIVRPSENDILEALNELANPAPAQEIALRAINQHGIDDQDIQDRILDALHEQLSYATEACALVRIVFGSAARREPNIARTLEAGGLRDFDLATDLEGMTRVVIGNADQAKLATAIVKLGVAGYSATSQLLEKSRVGLVDIAPGDPAVPAATIDLPEGFTPVTQCCPDHDRPVLAIRKSGYVCATFEIMTARFMSDYRPLSPWRDISNDAVGDSGEQILGWREMPEWFGPALDR